MLTINRILLVLSSWLIFLSVPCFAEIPASPIEVKATEALFLLDGNDLAELTHPEGFEQANAIGSRNGVLRFCKSDMSGEAAGDLQDLPGSEDEADLIADPLETVNRAFFYFNDKLYFWVLKPVATGYSRVVPEPLRVSVRNFFSNLYMPIRAANCLLQGKFKSFGTEIARFLLNSTMGVVGFGDPAEVVFNIKEQDEDLGQTLGFIGLGPVIYINWPILGPSSLRDTIGSLGDGFLNPINYIVDPTKYKLAIRGYEEVNGASLRLGEYESLKKAALDPYVSLRDAYHQHRQHKIKD